jgi:hypothetical protein
MAALRSRERTIQFWLEFARTDSHLAAMRIGPAAEPGKRQLRPQAAALGIFDAPSFSVGSAFFSGNHRLDDAPATATAP